VAKGGILGLHHVTATVDAAQPDLDFFASALGLRLVKQTVNFDNHHVYHFYYGDERGTPGTIWTTFPYHGHGVRVGAKGAGQITVTSFSVPAVSLPFWRQRLRAVGIDVRDEPGYFGESSVLVDDPSGLAIALVASSTDTREGWTRGGVEAESAIRGLHSVTLAISSPKETIEFMTRAMGFEVVGEDARTTRLAVNGRAPGRFVDILHAPDAPRAVNGLGTVHHVAFAVETADDQLAFQRDLRAVGRQVTPVMDRQYFTSIYFREPGGVLFEIATMGPGFMVDEPIDQLGRSLKLPPWEEPNRAIIRPGLATITLPQTS